MRWGRIVEASVMLLLVLTTLGIALFLGCAIGAFLFQLVRDLLYG